MPLPVGVEGLEVEDSADVFEIGAILPRVTSGRSFDGLRAHIAFEKNNICG